MEEVLTEGEVTVMMGGDLFLMAGSGVYQMGRHGDSYIHDDAWRQRLQSRR